MKNRVNYIDILKGIAIIAVVIGHTRCPDILSKYVYTWDLPLFFAISGYLYDEKKWRGRFKDFVIQRVRTYLLPYFSVCFIIFLLNQIENFIIDQRPDALDLLANNLFGILYSKSLSEYMINAVPLWYLTCIFTASILFYWLVEIQREKKDLIFVSAESLICVVVNCIIIGADLPQLPWHIDSVMFAMPFMLLGHYVKCTYYEVWISSEFIFADILIGFIFSILNPGYVHFATNRYGCIIFMYLGALFTIKGIWSLAYLLKKEKVLEFFGKNSLIIMCSNYYLDHILVRLLLEIGLDYYNISWMYILVAVLIEIFIVIVLYRRLKSIIVNAIIKDDHF